MSDDTVNLVIGVDTSDITKGGKALDDLTIAGGKTEKAIDQLGKATEKTNKSINDLNLNNGKASKATSRLASDITGLAAATKKAMSGTAAAAESTRKLDDELATLLSRINPAYAGLKDLDKGMDTLSRSLKAGIISTAQYASSVELLESRFAKAAIETEKSIISNARVRMSIATIGREIATGNFARIPSSMATLAAATGASSTALLGVVGAAIAAGVAIVGAGYAAFQSSKEFNAMNNALTLSGNISGLTAESMRDMAKSISDTSTLTIGNTKAMAIEFAASGQIGAAAFGSVMKASAAYAAVSGLDADKSAANMVKLFSDPAKGAEELNKSMHFLSLAELERINNLEESGQKTAAQTLLAGLLNAELEKHPVTLGALESAWNSAKKAASSYWDTVMGVVGGRAQSFQEKMDKVRWQIEHASPENQPKFRDQLRALELEQEKSATDALIESQKKEANSIDQQAMSYAKLNSNIAKKAELQNKIALMNASLANQNAGSNEAKVLAEGIASAQKAIADLGKIKDVKTHITDYQKLTQEIAKETAEEQKKLELGRDLTTSEKKLQGVIAGRASGQLIMTGVEFEAIKAGLEHNDAIEKQIKGNEKLKKSHEEVAKVIETAKSSSEDRIARLEFENSLIGKNAQQVALLTSAYQIDLDLKKRHRDIDDKMKGVKNLEEDAKEIASIQALSAARIKARRDEEEALIDKRYVHDVKIQMQGSKLGDGIPVGTQIVAEQAAALEAQARQEHAVALSKIEDLNSIRAVIEIEKKLKADIAASDAVYADAERLAAVGRAIREEEINKRISEFQKEEGNFGVTKLQFEEAELNLLNDKVLNQQRGMEAMRANAALSREILTAEAEAEKAKYSLKGGQLAFDNANLDLQQKLFDIAVRSKDIDVIKQAGMEYKKKAAEDTIYWLAKQASLDKKSLEDGALKADIDKERKIVNEAILAIQERQGDAASRAAKATADTLAEEEKRRAAILLTEKAQAERWGSLITTMESDFHNGMLRLLEKGNGTWRAAMKGYANSFKVMVLDEIYKALAKPMVLKIIMSIAGAVGADGVVSAAGNQLAGLPGGSSSGDLKSWIAAGKALWQGASAGFSTIGATFANAAAPMVSQLGGVLAENGMSTIGKYLMQSAADGSMGSLATAGSAFAGAAAGITIGTFIAGDKTFLGLNGMTTSALGSAVGAYVGTVIFPVIGTAIGSLIGGIAGGALNALFGRGPKVYGQTSVKGDFSSTGFSGAMVTPWSQKGGLFRSNKNGEDVTALTEEQRNALGSAMLPAVMSFTRLITVTGEATRSLDDWSFSINRQITNEEEFKTLQNDIANDMGGKLLPELVKFQEKGESLADTAIKMADTYFFTESMFRIMGFTTAKVGIASLEMRDNLVKLMGGFSAANTTLTSYYKNFYTEEEQHKNSLESVNKQFEALNVTVPKTRAEFRAMAETFIKDTTPAGQALFAAFIQLNEQFASVTQSTEDFAAAAADTAMQLADATKNIVSLLDKLRGTNAGSKTLAQVNANNTMNDLRLAAPWIKTFEQLATITAEDASQYSLANQKLIAAALEAGITLKSFADEAGAKRKQDVTDAFAGLQKSAEAERGVITEEYQKSLTKVSVSIDKLQTLSGALKQSLDSVRVMSRREAQAQIATALLIARTGGILPTAASLQKALGVIAQPSKDLFKTFVDYQRDQVLTGNDIQDLAKLSDSQLSTEEKTLQTLQDTQSQEMARLDGILENAQKQLDAMNGINNTVLSLADAMYKFSNALDNQKNPLTDFQAGMGISIVNGLLTFADTAAAAAPVAASQATFDDLVARRKASHGIPAFADGGDHAGGWRTVGETGTELEYTQPSHIVSNRDSKKLFDQTEVIALLRQILDVSTAGTIQKAEVTNKMAKALNNIDTRGVIVRNEVDQPIPVDQV